MKDGEAFISTISMHNFKYRRPCFAMRAAFVASMFAIALSGAHGDSSAARNRAQQWISAKFEGKPLKIDEGYLLPQLASGVIEKRARKGFPLQIANHVYQRGFHCPSTGTITVHLPSAASSFDAVIGVDSNDLSYYSPAGRGHAIVTVESGGKELFRSQPMAEGQDAVQVHVPLQGANEFTLQIKGTKEDAPWDQVTFADAAVTLSGGKVLQLDELPVGPIAAQADATAPFSFVYAGVSSREFLKGWKLTRSSRRIDEFRTEETQTYKDPATGLELRVVGTMYQDFPTVEWVLYFRNDSTKPTPIIENIQALDTRFERNGEGEFLLHHSKGAPATRNDYEPYETPIPQNSEQRLSAFGGRPTNKDLSYFNLAWPDEGVLFSVGWPGQWAAVLKRDAKNGIQVSAGQELTHFSLLPGEEVRTPLIVLQFWNGDWLDAQNIWRRWMLAHNVPRPNGKLPPPQMAGNTSREFVEMTEATDKDEIQFIDLYKADGLNPDYFWMDAGWYPNNGSWVNTGTWEVDTKRFPHGLRAVSDHAHSVGVKTIVWFEPERVTKGSWLYENHPEWLLKPPPNPGDQLYENEWRLFNFGDPAARQWMTEHVDRFITEQGVDLYRQDFNMDPLNFWRANDAPDRQGITEIRYVTGYLAYWDELRRRHPGMLIDSCASGGRRNDIETLRRAVPLTRSDYLLEPAEPISQQAQTYGMALWIPYFGTGVSGTDAYKFRSQMTPAIVTGWDLRRKDLDVAAIRTLVEQWRAIAGDYLGDFYPLTSYSLEKDVWAAMQFGQADASHGFMLAYRRSGSSYEKAVFKLHGLKSDSSYEVVNVDTKEKQTKSGHDLMTVGVSVELKQAPESALITYRLLGSQ
jgi:alpha-galactosidase